MTENKIIEVSGLDVDEAIESGLNRLGVSRDEVEIEVLEEGRRGLLGIGGRDAVVRLKVKPKPAPALLKPEKEVLDTESVEAEDEPLDTIKESAPPEVEADKSEKSIAAAPTAEETEVAIEYVSKLLELMHVDASVSSRLSEPDDLTGRRLAILDVEGDDLGMLIGPRGETLDALQYVSRLMVGHRLQQRGHFVIDIDGYREQRQQALSRLAERMAGKAVKRGSPVTLEAMPAHERRIIHMALRESPDVRTESTGEGKRRRVRIYPQ